MSARHRQLKKWIADKQRELIGIEATAHAYRLVFADMAGRSGDMTPLNGRYSFVLMRIEEVAADIASAHRRLAEMPAVLP